MRQLLGPPPTLSRLQRKALATELGTSCLSLGLVCFAVASGWAQRRFAAWEGGSWVASLEISLGDGNLGKIIFTNLKREAPLSFRSGCTT